MKKRYNLRNNHRDFTGGNPLEIPKDFSTTGDENIDKKIDDLIASYSCGKGDELIKKLIITSLKMNVDCLPKEDIKLFSEALYEMFITSSVFKPYSEERKISIFGSARTKSHEPAFKTAVSFAEKMKDVGFMAITGAGGGIMEAAQKGAGREDSFGLNIDLPFEQEANSYINNDEKLICFNYFFTRKLAFIKESDAIAAFPGGFGTMDELFETLTLIQTGKAQLVPILLIDYKGGTYWNMWIQFLKEHLLRLKLISEDDVDLFTITTDIDEAVREITNFYSNFHSYRYVNKKLVIRVKNKVSNKLLESLNKNFSNLLHSGSYEASEFLEEEKDEPSIINLPRIVCNKKPGMYGHFRNLIDRINEE